MEISEQSTPHSSHTTPPPTPHLLGELIGHKWRPIGALQDLANRISDCVAIRNVHRVHLEKGAWSHKGEPRPPDRNPHKVLPQTAPGKAAEMSSPLQLVCHLKMARVVESKRSKNATYTRASHVHTYAAIVGTCTKACISVMLIVCQT